MTSGVGNPHPVTKSLQKTWLICSYVDISLVPRPFRVNVDICSTFPCFSMLQGPEGAATWFARTNYDSKVKLWSTEV